MYPTSTRAPRRAAFLPALLLGSALALAACGGHHRGPPPITTGTFEFVNRSADTSYDVRLGGAFVGTIAPGERTISVVTAGTYTVEFFLAASLTEACIPEDFSVAPGEVTIVSCDAEACDVLGVADYTFRNTSTCSGIAQDYIWNGERVATLRGGESTTLRFTRGSATLRINWADSSTRACTDTPLLVESCEDSTVSCQGPTIAVFRFRNESRSQRSYDFYLGTTRVVTDLKFNEVSGPVYVAPGIHTVRTNFAGTATRACDDTPFSMSHCQQRTVICRGN